MRLDKIFVNYEDFDNDVIQKLKLLFPNAEWLDENNSYMSFNTLYQLLILYYGDRDIRYDNVSTFLNKFIFDLADILPDIYAKQQVFIKNNLASFLSDAKNRAIKIESNLNTNRNRDNESKAGSSMAPTNQVITSAKELGNLPITTANLNNITLIDNYNSTNEQVNFKFLDDLKKALNTDYSLRLQEFMNMISKHFVFIITSNGDDVNDGLYNGTRFRNGYYVSDVDYLGVENADQIALANKNIGANKIEIDKLKQNKQDKLTAGEGIKIENNVISSTSTGSSLDTYTKEQIDNKLADCAKLNENNFYKKSNVFEHGISVFQSIYSSCKEVEDFEVEIRTVVIDRTYSGLYVWKNGYQVLSVEYIKEDDTAYIGTKQRAILKIEDVATPTKDTDAANKKYVDDCAKNKLTAGENIEIDNNQISLKKDFKITLNDFTMEYKVDRLGYPSLNFIGNYAGGEKITSVYPGMITLENTKLEYDGITIYNADNSGYVKINDNSVNSYYGNQLEEYCFFKDEYKGVVRFQDLENVATTEQLSLKQDKLTAGEGIKIENNVISSTGGSGSSNNKKRLFVKLGVVKRPMYDNEIQMDQEGVKQLLDFLNNKWLVDKPPFIRVKLIVPLHFNESGTPGNSSVMEGYYGFTPYYPMLDHTITFFKLTCDYNMDGHQGAIGMRLGVATGGKSFNSCSMYLDGYLHSHTSYPGKQLYLELEY